MLAEESKEKKTEMTKKTQKTTKQKQNKTKPAGEREPKSNNNKIK